MELLRPGRAIGIEFVALRGNLVMLKLQRLRLLREVHGVSRGLLAHRAFAGVELESPLFDIPQDALRLRLEVRCLPHGLRG